MQLLQQVVIFLYIVVVTSNELVPAKIPEHGKVVFCYLNTWSYYYKSAGSFQIEYIDPTLCTHIVYAHVGYNETEDKIQSIGK